MSEEQRRLLTVPEFAKEARVGRGTVYRLIREGRLPVVRIGKTVRIPAWALEPEEKRAQAGEAPER